jgi:hypothetical protein
VRQMVWSIVRSKNLPEPEDRVFLHANTAKHIQKGKKARYISKMASRT